MIICSMPRCGATKICLDLEEQTGLKFVGELHPLHMSDKRKAEVHETRYQPSLSPEEFAEYLYNNKEYIILINQSAFYMLPFCDKLILRKNMMDSFLSGANFLLKMYPYMKANIIIHEVKATMVEYLAFKAYTDRYEVDTIWYEDYFNRSGTTTTLLDEHLHGSKIKQELAEFYHELIGGE